MAHFKWPSGSNNERPEVSKSRVTGAPRTPKALCQLWCPLLGCQAPLFRPWSPYSGLRAGLATGPVGMDCGDDRQRAREDIWELAAAQPGLPGTHGRVTALRSPRGTDLPPPHFRQMRPRIYSLGPEFRVLWSGSRYRNALNTHPTRCWTSAPNLPLNIEVI